MRIHSWLVRKNHYTPTHSVREHFLTSKMRKIDISEEKTVFRKLIYIAKIIFDQQYTWFFSIFLSLVISPKNTSIYSIKWNNEIVGGFTFSDFPSIRFHPRKILDFEFGTLVKRMIQEKRLYLSHFIIYKKVRSTGIGSQALKSFFSNKKRRAWLVSEKNAENFYIKNWIHEINKKYRIFTIN